MDGWNTNKKKKKAKDESARDVFPFILSIWFRFVSPTWAVLSPPVSFTFFLTFSPHFFFHFFPLSAAQRTLGIVLIGDWRSEYKEYEFIFYGRMWFSLKMNFHSFFNNKNI